MGNAEQENKENGKFIERRGKLISMIIAVESWDNFVVNSFVPAAMTFLFH